MPPRAELSSGFTPGFGLPGLATANGLDDLTWTLLIGAAVLLLALVAVRVSARSGLPTMLLYLAIGFALGEDGLGLSFHDAQLTQVLGYSALVLILAEGGLTTSWPGIRRSVAPAAVLSTVGVVVSVGVVAAAGRYVLDLSWPVALLVAAILSSTDAAAVFSVLRHVPLPRRLALKPGGIYLNVHRDSDRAKPGQTRLQEAGGREVPARDPLAADGPAGGEEASRDARHRRRPRRAQHPGLRRGPRLGPDRAARRDQRARRPDPLPDDVPKGLAHMSTYLELLPAVDVADGQAVQLVQGVAGSEKRFGDPVEAALRW